MAFSNFRTHFGAVCEFIINSKLKEGTPDLTRGQREGSFVIKGGCFIVLENKPLN